MRVTIPLVSLICLGGTQAFVAPSATGRPSLALSVQIPRVDLPAPVTDKLGDFGLKNPNTMTAAEYQSYSGAAILGTLLFFVLPGALVTGLAGGIGDVLGAVVSDFILSALIGGGAAIYLSLTDNELGGSIRDVGSTILSKGKELTGLETPRLDLPSQVTDVMKEQLGLMNPNDLNEKDYDGYAGAAVAGTLVFFLLPGAAITGAAENAGSVVGALISDFVLSAIVGGGGFIFLALRNDDIAKTVNEAGAKLLDTVDQYLGKTEALPDSKRANVPNTKANASTPDVSESKGASS